MQGPATPAPRTLHEAYAALRPLRILLAEDDAEMRRFLVRELEREGFIVEQVGDGAGLVSALQRLIAEPRADGLPDVVISDLRMPGQTGLDALAALLRAGVDLPFILITAFPDDEVHAQARRLGAAALFEKPFDVDDLKIALFTLPRAPGGRS